jgi:IS5 family transposase
MRKRFEQQIRIGQLQIEDTEIPLNCRDSLMDLLIALKSIYVDGEHNEKIFSILESSINANKQATGRPGMNLWLIFVLSQVRLCLNISYDRLQHIANHDKLVRQIMGVEMQSEFEQIKFEYQTIYDNVTLLDDTIVKELNEVIISFGHGVYKKKETEALRLKTDTFVVESNVHFPTDYNLLWDCARKSLDIVSKLIEKYARIKGWRKVSDWYHGLKGLMCEVGRASSSGGKNKQERVLATTQAYLKKAKALYKKMETQLPDFPQQDIEDIILILQLEHFIQLLSKHIDLVERRIIKGETIPHSEKMFSIFETYTEFIKKGKFHPNVEFGKKLAITTGQFNLIVDYQLMFDQQDRDITIHVAERLLAKYNIFSWSFDKGFWNKETKELLELEIPHIIMPKLGKRNKQEEEQEQSPQFKRLKNKHSAIESNINELEHRGLDRCPDKGIKNFALYVGLGVCAYNLKKIGRELLELERQKKIMQEKEQKGCLKQAA